MSALRYGSVCSGIEAATAAWHPLGWQPAFFSEIEPFPSAVLSHRYPNTPNLGDMTRFRDWPDYAIDILVGGTPCQSFSVAGLRKGLADPRGNLALTFLAIVDRYRPKWVVWENVPGVHSSWSDAEAFDPSEESTEAIEEARRAAVAAGIDLGADFCAGEFEEVDQSSDFDCFLAGLAELGYGVATRILDAQYVRVESHARAVPQRRRRVFVVGCLGDWRRAAAVLFERESLRGNPPPSRHARQGVAPTLSARTKGGGGLGTDFDCDGGLISREVAHSLCSHMAKGGDPTTDNYVAFSCKDHGADASEGVAPTMRAMGFDGSHANGGGQLAVAIQDGREIAKAQNGLGISQDGASYTIDTTGAQAVAIQAGALRENPESGPDGVGVRTDGAAYTIEARAEVQAVACFDERQVTSAANRSQCLPDACGTQHSTPHAVAVEMEHSLHRQTAVRRLTPRECERLQGFTSTTNRTIINLCFDRPSNSVRVGVKCLKSQSNALSADASGSREYVPSADVTFWNDQVSLEAVAAVHVRQSHVPMVRGIRSLGKCLWSVNGAIAPEASLPHTQHVDIAHALVVVQQELEALTLDGGAESPQSTKHFTLPSNGSWFAATFGPENEAHASGVGANRSENIKFITSRPGSMHRPSEQSIQIWLSSALSVIASFIPDGTRSGNTASYVIDVESDFTLIPVRGKPAADGPRYKALGNSMAVNVMSWIGRRIQSVGTLAPNPAGEVNR